MSSSRLAKSPRATTRIDAADQIARHLGRKHLEVCQETGTVLGVLFSGFKLRPEKQEKELSVNHLQYFRGETVEQVKAIKTDMISSGRTVGAESAYAILTAGQFSECGEKCGISLPIYKRPEPGNPSHAEVTGMPADNARLDLLESLAKVASQNIFPAKNF